MPFHEVISFINLICSSKSAITSSWSSKIKRLDIDIFGKSRPSTLSIRVNGVGFYSFLLRNQGVALWVLKTIVESLVAAGYLVSINIEGDQSSDVTNSISLDNFMEVRPDLPPGQHFVYAGMRNKIFTYHNVDVHIRAYFRERYGNASGFICSYAIRAPSDGIAFALLVRSLSEDGCEIAGDGVMSVEISDRTDGEMIEAAVYYDMSIYRTGRAFYEKG